MDWSHSVGTEGGRGVPWLEILLEPQPKFRFRYRSEMSGKHGSLLAAPQSPLSIQSSKTYPTVKLHNFVGSGVIRCSLVSEAPPHYPHPHLLDNGTGTGGPESPEPLQPSPYLELPVSPANEHTAIFQGLNIIYSGKKSVRKELGDRLRGLPDSDPRKRISPAQLETLALGVNLNVVSLYFEGLDQDGRPLCSPVVSAPVQHNKSTQTSELRIVRIDKYTSSCLGDEEVFVLVEKVDKQNIQVKFFEENEKGTECWKAYGRFTKLDVHHQYAIVFKTPAYRSTEIDTEVDVWVQLERPSDGATSRPLRFKYKPIERLRKMPKRTARRSESNSGEGGGEEDRLHPDMPSQPGPSSSASHPRPSSPHPEPSGSGGIRQGAAMFPCDPSEGQSRSLALNVALSVGESLHVWAETSDFNLVLRKLRHLLCLVNDNGDNALHTAILNEQPEPFRRILATISSSPDVSHLVNQRNVRSLSPLALAVLSSRPDFVQLLLREGADPGVVTTDGDTALHLAVRTGNMLTLQRLLLSPSPIINHFNYRSMTPLHVAVSEGCLESVGLLCREGAHLGSQEGLYGRTPLHMAVERGNFGSTLLLLKAADERELVNIQNYRGDTALHYAVSMDCPSPALVALLLYFGADPKAENYLPKDCEEGEVESGMRPLDLVTNPEVGRLLEGGPEDWDRVLKFCSFWMEGDLSGDKILSLESLTLDSGIDIKDLTS